MEEFDLVYRDIRLRICCDYEIANIVKNHFYGHIKLEKPEGNPTYLLIVEDNLELKDIACYKKVDKWFDYASLDFYIDNSNSACYITNINANNNKNRCSLISASVANLFNRLLELKGYIGLHAACVEKENDGVLFVAERNSGKTVCMLNLMNNGYNLVANDATALKKIDDELMGYGIAQSVSIRLSPSFCSKKENEKYINLAIQKGIKIKDKEMLDGNNFNATDSELANINNVSLTIESPIKFIVRPCYDPTINHLIVYQMPIEQTRELVYSQYKSLVHETSDFLINVKLDGVDEAERYRHFEDIVTIPAYYCRQNEKTNDEFVKGMELIRKK